MVVDGTEYGEVRQYGNFSFARIYESGHEIPYYQRKSISRPAAPTVLINVGVLMRSIAVAALGYFNRTLYHWDIATGEKKVTANLTSSGPANATHTNSYVALSTSYVPAFPSPIYPVTTSVY
jgi:hypothetical protein